MPGITYETASAQLEKYIAAEEKILLGQAVDMDGCRLTYADLASVQAGIRLWDSRVKSLTPASQGGGLRVQEIIPR